MSSPVGVAASVRTRRTSLSSSLGNTSSAAHAASAASHAVEANSCGSCPQCAARHNRRPIPRASQVQQCPHPLLLTSLAPAHIAAATGALVGVLLFHPQLSHRYFSYTHTQDELSLLLDPATAAAAFPAWMLQGNPALWRALEVIEGAEIIDVPGIVNSLCGPLLQDPTVASEVLYLSTFNSDLILVREPALQTATALVSGNLSFLVESRQRAHEELARAEAREIEEARQRALMEEEDRWRAIAGTGEEDDDEELDAEDADGFKAVATEHETIRAPPGSLMPAASQLGSSVSSSSQNIFELELHSRTGGSPGTHTVASTEQLIPSIRLSEAALNRPPAPFAQKLDFTPQPVLTAAPVPASASAFAGAASAAAAAAPPTASLQQLHLEPEGDDGAGGDDESSTGSRPRGASSDGIDAHLSCLPFRLALLTFHVDHLPHCTHAILHALMHRSAAASSSSSSSAGSSESEAGPASLRPHFFSMTQAGSEVSLIVEASSLPLFPAACVSQHRSVWRAIQVSQGSEAGVESGASLVAPLSATLARHGYSILYLSTATFDFILVGELQVDDAIKAIASDMRVIID